MTRYFPYKIFMISLLLLLTLFNSGCTPALQQGNMFVNRAVLNEQATVMPRLLPTAKRPYLLQVGDVIDVKFFYSPELNETPVVRPDGRISMQLLGDVQAAGRTPLQLADGLREGFKQILSNPEITVVVKQYSPQRIFIAGEVARPGELPLQGGLSVLQAVAQSGDFTHDAERDSVIVLRNNGTVALSFHLLDFVTPKADRIMSPDLSASACDEGNIEQCDRWMAAVYPEQFELRPADVVFVPPTKIANVSKFFERYVGNIIPIFRNMGFALQYTFIP